MNMIDLDLLSSFKPKSNRPKLHYSHDPFILIDGINEHDGKKSLKKLL